MPYCLLSTRDWSATPCSIRICISSTDGVVSNCQAIKDIYHLHTLLVLDVYNRTNFAHCIRYFWILWHYHILGNFNFVWFFAWGHNSQPQESNSCSFIVPTIPPLVPIDTNLTARSYNPIVLDFLCGIAKSLFLSIKFDFDFVTLSTVPLFLPVYFSKPPHWRWCLCWRTLLCCHWYFLCTALISQTMTIIEFQYLSASVHERKQPEDCSGFILSTGFNRYKSIIFLSLSFDCLSHSQHCASSSHLSHCFEHWFWKIHDSQYFHS